MATPPSWPRAKAACPPFSETRRPHASGMPAGRDQEETFPTRRQHATSTSAPPAARPPPGRRCEPYVRACWTLSCALELLPSWSARSRGCAPPSTLTACCLRLSKFLRMRSRKPSLSAGLPPPPPPRGPCDSYMASAWLARRESLLPSSRSNCSRMNASYLTGSSRTSGGTGRPSCWTRSSANCLKSAIAIASSESYSPPPPPPPPLAAPPPMIRSTVRLSTTRAGRLERDVFGAGRGRRPVAREYHSLSGSAAPACLCAAARKLARSCRSCRSTCELRMDNHSLPSNGGARAQGLRLALHASSTSGPAGCGVETGLEPVARAGSGAAPPPVPGLAPPPAPVLALSLLQEHM
mmetsp:Transcript_38064/g.123169  ORF Transcript_38064/g.123169 Transcript_38064/m.123169 type:complete len:352 (+) Transcript_38064:495-1550(+)